MKKLFVGLLSLTLFAYSPITSLPLSAQEEDSNQELSAEETHDLKESSISAEDLLVEIEAANADTQSVQTFTELDIRLQNPEETSYSFVYADFYIFYDKAKKVTEGYIYTESDNNGQTENTEALLLEGDSASYSRTKTNSDWEDFSEGDFAVNPDFHQLLASVVSIEDELTVYENEDSYVLMNSDSDIDLFSPFQSHYSLSFSGVDASQYEQTIFIEFNKDDLRFKHIDLDFNFEEEDSHINLSVNSTFDLWNKINEDFVDQVYNGEIEIPY
ncbi:hypothetical protein HZY91_07205 [Facklamia sp. DSM 111018]|uniref:Uncharacterized protein n=1 Tax=Facklamia lactis TaxID=2749967 RepID=A0ABS0LRA1_9LACT|nr:hypothetical protein [Facklamia lactis]MBG9980956.1 hypothetical protein [Facklamia lactis]MBG9986681.1 hypothetical protein [Facklamia lactis]